MATKTASTGRESDKFMLRFPEGMRAQIKAAAEENGRTMNAEIVARLEASFSSSSPGMPPTLREELERLLDEKLGGIKAVIDTKNGLQQTTIVRKK